MSRGYSRGGFRNYGGSPKGGFRTPIDIGDMDQLRKIHRLIIEQGGILSTVRFDELSNNMGDIIRYTLRKEQLIVERQVAEGLKLIDLTSKAQSLLKALPENDSNLPS